MLQRPAVFIFMAAMLQAALPTYAQLEALEVGETMEEYIRENHLDEIEDMVHKFTSSKVFLNHLLQQGHDIDPGSIELKRNDVSVGRDIDIYVKHLSEHQNFTMLLVPVDIYPLALYDTLLFAVLEVSDAWLHEKFYHYDLVNDSIKYLLMSEENHSMLTRHMYHQALLESGKQMAEVEVHLHETFISSGSITVHTSELEKEEKHQMLQSWGLLKKALRHSIDLNVEMNIYVFGYDDMEIVEYSPGGQITHKITPRNIFTRHHFAEK